MIDKNTNKLNEFLKNNCIYDEFDITFYQDNSYEEEILIPVEDILSRKITSIKEIKRKDDVNE